MFTLEGFLRMKHLFWLALVALLAIGSLATLAFADDEVLTCTTDPADGSLPECGTRADNECYDGGTMADKCDNDWLWKAGWEIARFNNGTMTREQVNPEWAFLLPPPVEPVEGAPGVLTICHPISAPNPPGTICLRADQTGYLDYASNGQYEYLEVFVDNPADCTPTYLGYPFIVSGERDGFARPRWGFTVAELDSLGLKPHFCEYQGPGND
jgi:hypothetical protein